MRHHAPQISFLHVLRSSSPSFRLQTSCGSVEEIWDFRSNTQKPHDTISIISWISASITQGSVLGPPSYMVVAFDLHPQNDKTHCRNTQMTLTYSLDPKNIRTVVNELAGVAAWAASNNLKLNPQ